MPPDARPITSPLDILTRLTVRERFRIDYRRGRIEIHALADGLRPADLYGLRLPVVAAETEVWLTSEGDSRRLRTVATGADEERWLEVR